MTTPVYRLEIDRGDTLWVTAHDDRGAIELASAHVAGETKLEEATSVKLTHYSGEMMILRAAAGKWSPYISVVMRRFERIFRPHDATCGQRSF